MFECETSILRNIAEIDESSKIIAAEVGCGATTQNSIHIGIAPVKDELLKDFRGNIFVTNDQQFDAEKNVTWEVENQTLTILHGDTSKIFKMEDEYQNITIRYIRIK
jgi:hypothetical protein